jgi:urease accessory protein UreE
VLFKNMPGAAAAYREETLPDGVRGWRRETMTLGWEERLKGRARRSTDAGTGFATALPRGTVLRAGDLLPVDALRLVVSVVERAEPVFVIEPVTPREWGLFAYQIGNCHQPLMVDGSALVCPDVAGVAMMLAHFRIPYRRDERPFTPASGLADHRHA